jgi:ferredoxin
VPAAFSVEFELPDGSRRRVGVEPGEYLLDAGLDAGLDLPSLCLQGWCLTCAARVLEGKVDQSDSRRYYPEDEEAGFALLCTATPLSDLRLKTHQTEAMRAHRDAHGLPATRGT